MLQSQNKPCPLGLALGMAGDFVFELRWCRILSRVRKPSMGLRS
jgi:hypothetical protein